MEAFMNDLSPKPEQGLARTSSQVAYNRGRNAEMLSAVTTRGLQWVIRSSVLEPGTTCQPCAMLDGSAFPVGSPEYAANHPPAHCAGGIRCRCFYIPVEGV